MLEIKEVLEELRTPRTVHVNSSPALAQSVAKARGQLDAKLSESGQDLPRRKDLQPLPAREAPTAIKATPWEILHRLGRATVLSGQGASRGLAEHWGCLKYCQALCGHQNGHGAMALSTEGLEPVYHHKSVQSEELGIGFALAAAARVLARRWPDHTFTVVDADIALQAGWALGGRGLVSKEAVKLRPDYFIEARPPRGPSKVVVLECKGTHRDRYAYNQLAKASSQVDAVHLAGSGALPSLAIATELKAKAGITLNILDPEGDGTLDVQDDDQTAELNRPVDELNIPPHFRVPVEDEEGHTKLRTISGFRITPEHYAWFRNVLARTTAAGLMAFCGDRNGTAPFLTKRQGFGRFAQRFAFSGTGSVRDVTNEIHGIPFVGTDQVFRLNGVRLEAFSGLAEPLFDRLDNGDVASYRQQASEIFETWKGRSREGNQAWDGPISVDADGSIMALRQLPQWR